MLKTDEENLIKEVKEKLEIFNDKNFIFEPIEHVYTYNDNKYISVTTFLNNFVNEFDEDFWSKKKAKDRGVEQEVILNEWAITRDRGCDLGTMVHEYIEDFYVSDTKAYDDDEVNERIVKFHEIFDKRLNVLTPIFSELRIFDHEWKIAGTLDQLYTYKNMLIIGDWKTNKKIKTDKDYCFGWLKYPFNKYKDNELNKYSIQISLYALILKRMANIDIDYSFICHIPAKGEAKIYKLKDFSKELEMYFNSLKTKTKKIENKSTETVDLW